MKITTPINIALFILFSFSISTAWGQTSGYVVYKRNYSFADLYYFDTLRFNEGELLYIEKRERQKGKTRSGYNFKIAERDQAWFLDLATLKSIEQKYDKKSKEYDLSSEPAQRLDWEIHEEYRQIGRYQAQKATTDHPDPNYGTTTAWFTTEVPIPGGPDRLWGLPGLILECSTKGSFKGAFVMEQIVFAPQGTLRPSEGNWVEGKDGQQVSKRTLRDLLNKDY